jgi:pyruvate kinase
MTLRRTKILATLGPATTSREQIREVVAAGADAVRLNFSHGDPEEHALRLEHARAVSAELGRPLAAVQDIQGPKVRLGRLEGGGARLSAGDEVELVPDDSTPTPAPRLPVASDTLLDALEPGLLVLLDEGQVRLRVRERTGSGARATVEAGGDIRDRIGVVVQELSLPLQPLTDKDLADLEFGVALGVDVVALSYVTGAKGLLDLRGHLDGLGSTARTMAKIETRAALRNLPEILAASDGVMVARGDLGLHIPVEEVPREQKLVLKAALETGALSVTATQMLQSMTSSPVPTRAEATDVFNAVFDGTSAVMLSAETSLGEFAPEAVRTMDRICRKAEETLRPRADGAESRSSAAAPHEPPSSLAAAIGRAACRLASEVGARAILAPTRSGATARAVARFRPPMPLLAASPDPGTVSCLALEWGAVPLLVPPASEPQALLDNALSTAVAKGHLSPGDLVVVAASARVAAPGSTDLIRVVVAR